MSFHSIKLGPGSTPKGLKYLIYLTLCISLFAAATHYVFPHYFGWISPQQLLSLSAWGLERGFFWQLITYIFVQPTSQGITFSLFLTLAFNSYLLWTIGTSLIERKGRVHFFSLYLIGSLITGLFLFLYQSFSSNPLPFAGNSAILYTLLTAWLAFFPRAEFLLFMIIPMRASWLVLGMLSINLLIDLSRGDWMQVIAYLTAALCGFVYGKLIIRETGAYTFSSRTKKFDFKTGRAILTDEEFLDEMLTKISLKGRRSLTLRERLRLHRLTKRQKRQLQN